MNRRSNNPAGSRRLRAITLVAGLLCAFGAHAQVSDYGQKQMGDPAPDRLPRVLDHVTIDQHLNTQLPLDANFVDDTGKPVKLGQYFNGTRPAVLALVYYNCPMLCSETLDGLVSSLIMVKFNPGKDYDVVVASIDPSEGPALAAKEKRIYTKRFARPGTNDGWHFLTGQQPAIDALTRATGFGYVRTSGPDGRMNQFAHASAIQLVTPDGRIAQYYMGVEYSPKDMRLGLVEAGEGRIGTPVDKILTYCYHYDPAHNGHSLLIARIVQAGCMLTLICLATYMLVNFRRDRRMGMLLTPRPHGNG
jgi:protein SCO1/2